MLFQLRPQIVGAYNNLAGTGPFTTFFFILSSIKYINMWERFAIGNDEKINQITNTCLLKQDE